MLTSNASEMCHPKGVNALGPLKSMVYGIRKSKEFSESTCAEKGYQPCLFSIFDIVIQKVSYLVEFHPTLVAGHL